MRSDHTSSPPVTPTNSSPGGWGKTFLGFAAGLALSAAYIQLNWSLPAWLRLPGLVQSLGPRTVADAVLEDPTAPFPAKQRAVEELFRHDPQLFRELDSALDHAITQAVIARKARHRLQLFQAKQETRQTSLASHPALLEAALRLHQTKDPDTLHVHMGIQDLREDPFLLAFLQQRFPDLPEDGLLRATLRLKPDALFPTANPSPQSPPPPVVE